MNTTDPDGPVADAGPALSTAASRATARRLRRARQRLGAHRHDLLVAMRVVNGVEAQLVQSEWENWLADEMARCDRIRALLEEVPSGPGAGGGGGSSAELQKRALLRAWREQYCGSCQADRLALLAAGRGAGPSLV